MYQYLDKKEHGSAYTTGCLGITESDWRALGRAALDALDLDVARKSFARLKDLRYLEFLDNLLSRKKTGAEAEQVLLAHVLAFQGKYNDAAKIYKKQNEEQRALTMFTDLRMFDLASEYLATGDSAGRIQSFCVYMAHQHLTFDVNRWLLQIGRT